MRQNDVALEIQYETGIKRNCQYSSFKTDWSSSRDSLNLTWELKLPKNISAVVIWVKAYQLTQWYPKVALLDTNGWHTMSYLEFGSSSMEIIGSTSLYLKLQTWCHGVLLNEDEKLADQSIRHQHLQNIITDISCILLPVMNGKPSAMRQRG